MKELTIEQKAKHYDEAKARMSAAYNSNRCTIGFMNEIFPELKESEDERIRKFIANELICLRAAFDKGDCRYEELSNAINWLEKHEDCQKKINHAYAKGLADAQKALKKQGECHISHDDEIMIKQLTEYFTTGHGLQNANGTVVEWLNDVKEKLEKQGKKEVKSTEEFETFVRWFVKQRTDNYTLIPSEEDIRKWADLILSRAKQELEKQGEQILANSAKTCKDEQKPNLCDECVNRKGCINCENGELREIEQKPIDKVEPFDEYEGLTDFERTLADICIGWIGQELGWKQYIKDNADVLLKIAIKKFNSVQDTIFEQKPTDKVEPKFKVGDVI